MRALDREVNDIVRQAIEPLVPVPLDTHPLGRHRLPILWSQRRLRATMAVERAEPSVATRAEDGKASAVPAGADRPPTSEEEEAAESAQLDQETKESVTKHYREMAELGADVEGEGHIP